jgi:ELWxxDGT repeat protein
MIAFTTSGQTPYLVKLNPDFPQEGPSLFIEYKEKLMFRTRTAEFGRELWQSDGTEEGTRMLKNINEDPNVSEGNSDPVVLTKFKNLVFFAATDAIHGRKLWVTDGTEEGTRFFKEIALSNGNAHIIFEDKLFFVANDEIHGFELWVSDGTSEGTRLLMDINPGIGNGSPLSFTLADGYFFFSADNGVNGRELWRSDGTPENTYMIKDILPGPSSSFLGFINGIFEQGKFIFAASDSIHGNELWMSDGNEAGTVLLKDIRSGTPSSSPGSFFSSLGYVYFLAFPTGLGRLYTILSSI